MVAFNFQKQFVEAVETGAKRQTIRARARCKPGDRLQLYYGMRTRQCRKIADAICTAVAQVEIDNGRALIAGQPVLNPWSLGRFAELDGFQGYSDMLAWLEKTHGLPFCGFLIQWKPA